MKWDSYYVYWKKIKNTFWISVFVNENFNFPKATMNLQLFILSICLRAFLFCCDNKQDYSLLGTECFVECFTSFMPKKNDSHNVDRQNRKKILRKIKGTQQNILSKRVEKASANQYDTKIGRLRVVGDLRACV